MSGKIVLVATADQELRAALCGVTRSMQLSSACECRNVTTIGDVVSQLHTSNVGLLLLHVTEQNAEEVLEELGPFLSHAGHRAPAITILDHDDCDLRLQLLRLGAVASLPRPLDLSRLSFLADLLTISWQHRATFEEERTDTLPVADTNPSSLHEFFFSSEMRTQRELAKRLAPLQTTVLLTGETGTGKNLFARLLHDLSPRQNRPFIPVECGTLSPTLFASELFGHVRGAFTGADKDRIGKFAEAKCGTVLLDEVDSVPLEVQANLLWAVDDRQFMPVGSNQQKRLQARLIVATNQDLKTEVREGRFRRDLYYRLNVVEIRLPPLREQRKLIRPLATSFLRIFSQRPSGYDLALSEGALLALEAYDWPGNVRELRNVMERCAALCLRDVVDLAELPDAVRACAPAELIPPPSAPAHGENALERARHLAEYHELLNVLQRNENCRSRAAKELGISRTALYKKLHRFNLL